MIIRRAAAADLPAIVDLLADDDLGARREAPGDPVDMRYRAAFRAIDTDPNALLMLCVEAGTIVGCLQLNFIAGLSRRGARRGQIEGVRVAASHRGAGIGQAMMAWAMDRCRERGCSLVQLTTDKSRTSAFEFYRRLGFEATHEGMKRSL